jgi:hypothetical protein
MNESGRLRGLILFPANNYHLAVLAEHIMGDIHPIERCP